MSANQMCSSLHANVVRFLPGIGGLLFVDGLRRCHGVFKHDEKMVRDEPSSLKDEAQKSNNKKENGVTP
jgi:hypothetical protein